MRDRGSKGTRRAATPVPPHVDDELTGADIEQLADDREWTDLEITGDLNALDAQGVGISACRFVHTQLSGSNLSHARLVDSVFVDCDLSGMALEVSTLIRVEFRNCRLSGLVLNGSTLRDVFITDSKADGMSMRGASCECTTIERSALRGVDLSASRLVMTRLFDCDLEDSDFSRASFDDVKLHGSSLSGLRGIGDIRGVSIGDEQLGDFALGLLAAHQITVTERENETE